MIDDLKANTEIALEYIKKTHDILCKEAIESVPGKFKFSPNMIVGADFQTTPPYLVPTELENWRQNLLIQLQNAKTNDEVAESICRQHIYFERIPPFPDGNGRVGRALMVYSCLQTGSPPIVVPVEEKRKYISFLNTENLNELIKFAKNYKKKKLNEFKLLAARNKMLFGLLILINNKKAAPALTGTALE